MLSFGENVRESDVAYLAAKCEHICLNVGKKFVCGKTRKVQRFA